MTRNDRRINRRFSYISTREPEFDDISMMVHPDERVIFKNEAAKAGANIVLIINSSERK